LQIASEGTSRNTGFLCYPGRLSSNYPVRVSPTNGDSFLSLRHGGYLTSQVFDNPPCACEVQSVSAGKSKVGRKESLPLSVVSCHNPRPYMKHPHYHFDVR